MTIAVIYPTELKRILMIGLGGARSPPISDAFLRRPRSTPFELDKRVISVAKTYFGLRESERVRYLDGDAGCSSTATRTL